MTPKVGGTLQYFCRAFDQDNKQVKLNDFNAKISFNRDEGSNSVMISNGTTKVEKGNYESWIRVRSQRTGEISSLEHAFKGDGDEKTFSRADYEKLLDNIGRTIKVGDGFAYKVKANDEEKAKGIVHICICEVLADGTARQTGESITIDIQVDGEENEETLQLPEARLKVKWEDSNGKTKSREIMFKGNFRFKVDGETYTVKDGKIYNEDNKNITSLELDKTNAYQLIGMTNFAQGAKDYTFTSKELQKARNEVDYSGNSYCNRALGFALGSEFAGDLCDQAHLHYKNGVFTSEVTVYERRLWGIIGGYKSVPNKVSIWAL